MFKYKLFLVIFLLRCTYSTQKLDIDIFYESLCPDSLNFIKYQLQPAWNDIKPYVNLNLVPFGKSVSFNDANFDCQHGPRECEGNRIMSCTLHKMQDSSLQVYFTNCYMNIFLKHARRNRGEFGQSCISKAGLDWDNDVKHCYESHLGTLLQLNAEKQTKVYKPQFIPTIVYDKKFDQDLQDNSLYSFKEVACSLIKKMYPDACEK